MHSSQKFILVIMLVRAMNGDIISADIISIYITTLRLEARVVVTIQSKLYI